MKNRDQWLAERRLGIGGSDVQHLFPADCKYGCPRQLWLDKTNVPVDYPKTQEQEDLLEYGHLLEPIIADRYAAKHGVKLRKIKSKVSKTHPFMRVNVDRMITGFSAGPGYLECKSMGMGMFNQLRAEGQPMAHILQMQHGLAVTGWNWGAFAYMCRDSAEFESFTVNRDDDMVELLTAKEQEFWGKVQRGDMPEGVEYGDDRCVSCQWRKTCRGPEWARIAEIKLQERPKKFPVNEEISQELADLSTVKLSREQLDALETSIKQTIKQKLGDAPGAEVPSMGLRVHFQEQVSMRVDTNALKAKYPAIYEELAVPSKSRPLKTTTL